MFIQNKTDSLISMWSDGEALKDTLNTLNEHTQQAQTETQIWEQFWKQTFFMLFQIYDFLS